MLELMAAGSCGIEGFCRGNFGESRRQGRIALQRVCHVHTPNPTSTLSTPFPHALTELGSSLRKLLGSKDTQHGDE